ncbi:hypothetical protein [Magnetospirillum sp. UT-4]|uniref:hypothetical protein n=1 Tax=Magnetospirillum sp. UT-4 TaxID=2681467 RepID=UPI0013820BE6|nr:hypothetical protein [Magnetospirillum sp. UT-4]CAA7621993.1 hypothetical protein MTBUT4_40183 [Magnetospirillum sp. UT-4]
MDRFAVNEARMLYFHRVLVDQARRTPNLVARAVEALPGLRQRSPAQEALWDRWEVLLAAGLDVVAKAVLADSVEAGSLRATSPLAEILEPEERNALWQRVGLQQFAAYYLAAIEDLGLSLEEESAIVGIGIEELSGWSDAPPLAMTQGTLDALKMVIAIQRALATILPEPDERRAWLRGHVDAFAASPVAVLTNGGGAIVQAWLTAQVQPLLGAEDRPSH